MLFFTHLAKDRVKGMEKQNYNLLIFTNCTMCNGNMIDQIMPFLLMAM